MAEYSKVNLREVEDQAPKYGMPPGLQSRFAREPLGLEKTGMTHYTFDPDYRFPFGHKHVDHEEVYVLVSGSARIKVEDEVIELEPWDAIAVAGSQMRNLQAGPEGAEVLAFGQRAGMEDSTLEQGWWSD